MIFKPVQGGLNFRKFFKKQNIRGDYDQLVGLLNFDQIVERGKKASRAARYESRTDLVSLPTH